MADKYITLIDIGTQQPIKIKVIDNEDGTYTLDTKATLNVGDIQLGQVELKDSDSTAQANIKAANTARTTATVVVATQHIDASGQVGGVQGQVASGAADSGNPVKVGGKYNASAPTLDDGDRGDLQLNSVSQLVNAGLDNFYVTKCVPGVFNGGVENARGDDGGTKDGQVLFTVTGDVLLAIYGVCTTLLEGDTSQVSVGLTGNTALLLPVTTATEIDANEIFMDATPAIGKPIDSLNFYVVGNGVDVIETIATANITAGDMYYVCLWKSLTLGSGVVSAI